MIKNEDLLDLLPGKRVVITDCESAEHGENTGCLCHLRGTIVTVGERYQTVFAGTPTWWVNNDRRARMSEMTLIKES